MQTFFQNLSEYVENCDVNITVTKKNGKLTVGILPKPKVDDPAKDSFRPITMTGEAHEVDAGFFNSVKDSLNKADQFAVNTANFEEGMKEAEKNSKAAKKKEEEAKKDFDKLMTDLKRCKTDEKKKEKLEAALKHKDTLSDVTGYKKKIQDAEKDLAKLGGEAPKAEPREDKPTEEKPAEEAPAKEEPEPEKDLPQLIADQEKVLERANGDDTILAAGLTAVQKLKQKHPDNLEVKKLERKYQMAQLKASEGQQATLDL